MEEQIPLSDFPIRSEEILAIQNDILNLQDGLDTVVNDNISRNAILTQASKSFFEFLQQLYQRGGILQKYAKTLIERENQLAIEQRKYNSDLLNLRIINVDLPAEEEKLEDIREKLNELTEIRQKNSEQLDLLKQKIQSMITEHNSIADQIEKVHLGVTDDLYDDMGDTNVNVFIEVQNLRKEIENTTKQIEITKENIQNNIRKKEYLNNNMDYIISIKQSLKNIPDIQENISSVSKQIKEIRLKQRDERVKALQYSTELNQLCQQQDEVYENLETHRSLNSKIPNLNVKVVESEFQINQIKSDLNSQLQEYRAKKMQNIEIEKKTEEELELLNTKYNKECQKSEVIESKIAEVDILIDDQNREKYKKQKFTDLDNIDNKYKKEKIKSALLKFNILNPAKPMQDDDLYDEKKKLLEIYDEINKEIADVNYQIGQIHFKIEYELMRQNVLEAEEGRLSNYQNSMKSDSYVTCDTKRKFKNDNESENSVCQFITKRKIDRDQQIFKQKQELSELESLVSMKKSRTLVKSQKIAKIRNIYDESVHSYNKSNDKTEADSFSGLENGSQIDPKKLRKNELFKQYIQKVSDTFQSQSKYWKDIETNNDNETRSNLINWAMQIDQANKKLQYMSDRSSLNNTKSQSFQSSKTEVSTYLENIENNSFSYSDL
ncbi:hypothetical protein M9Y10_024435 [Tritrichomonas musculus]|uniref:Uncharacterized protein n=1 Tax=Tritrichomonas musculus TaxID=1915356 RepID=A0ABR2HBZ6_9EUKA